MCYDKITMNREEKYYELHHVTGLTFIFKLDLNPVTSEYEPHIWHRHLLEPAAAVAAYLNQTIRVHNHKYNRYEAYSELDKITIYYNPLGNNKVMIITAFKE
jgi:hypothetical protein